MGQKTIEAHRFFGGALEPLARGKCQQFFDERTINPASPNRAGLKSLPTGTEQIVEGVYARPDGSALNPSYQRLRDPGASRQVPLGESPATS